MHELICVRSIFMQRNKNFTFVPGTSWWLIKICGGPFPYIMSLNRLMESGHKHQLYFTIFYLNIYNISHSEVIFYIFYTEISIYFGANNTHGKYYENITYLMF